MKTANIAVMIAGSVLLASSYASVGAQTSTVLDGIYTEAQAKRGLEVYTKTCEACHGKNLMGTETGPPLMEKDFVAGWVTMSVGELLEKIATSMPSNEPGKLKKEENSDVLAYVLSMNKYPAGMTELGTDLAPLKNVKMAQPPPKP